MKTKISDILIELTSQTPILLCVLAGIMPQWRWGILAIAAIGLGILLWWRFKKQNFGIICIVAGLLCIIVAFSNSRQKPDSIPIAELGDDPLRSFFFFDQRAQEAWDTNNMALFEEVATVALKEAVKQGSNRVPFAYYDNIWHKLEMAKNNGSEAACYNMAFMCANGLGRRRSVDDAVEFCKKAIQMDPSDPIPFILLEDMQIDSLRYPEAYSLLSEWYQKIDDYEKRIEEFATSVNEKGIRILRDDAFRKVLFHDTASKIWKLIDDNVCFLRSLSLNGKSSTQSLFLAAYYRGKNCADSAVIFYDKFMSSDMKFQKSAVCQAIYYSVIPDTVVNVFSRGITPFLLGLSTIDADYLGKCAATNLSDILPSVDTLNYYFTMAAYISASLKEKYFLYQKGQKPSNILSLISKNYYRNISKHLATQKQVIGKPKSNKYKYNYIVDIHNTSTPFNSIPNKSVIICLKNGPMYEPTAVYFFGHVGSNRPDELEQYMNLNRIESRFHEQLTHKPYY